MNCGLINVEEASYLGTTINSLNSLMFILGFGKLKPLQVVNSNRFKPTRDLHHKTIPSLLPLTLKQSQAYEVLLVNYQEKFPISSPSKGHGDRTARSLARKEGDAVQEQYLRIKADVSRLLYV